MVFFFSKDRYKISSNLKKRRPYSFEKKYTYTSMYPHESDNTMLFPLFVLVLFTLFVGTIGIHFDYGIIYFDILSKWLTPSTNLLHPNASYSVDWYEFFTNAIFSVSITIFGLLIAYVLYGSVYSLFQNLEFINSFIKGGPKRIFLDKIKNRIYNWSYNCGYIDIFYTRVFTLGIRGKQLRPQMTAVIIALAVIFSGLTLSVVIWKIPLAIPTVVAVVLFVVFTVVTALLIWFPKRKFKYSTNFDTIPRTVARRAFSNKPIRTKTIPRTVARRELPNEPMRTTTIENFLNKLAQERPIRFLPQQLAAFTQNFTVKLGSGAFGSVYKGELPDRKPIAVKVLVGIMDKRMEEQFMAEVGTIAGTQHINLVRLYGFCYDDTLIAQVYEYMENGSLDKFLFNDTLRENDRKVIEFGMLYEIAIGTAKGIRYLHEECQRRIIHYDIKPGNILLDANFNPKVADFGLAKLMNREYTHMSMTGMRGTPGYAAPEMWTPFSPVTYKCDVYSFGMLLFEMVGRRKNFDCRAAESEQKWFPKLVYKQWDSGMLGEVMAACGIEQKEERERAVRMCKVALWCVQYSAEARPSMSKVVQMLEGQIEIEPPPNPFTNLYVSDVPDSDLRGRISISNDLQNLLPV